MEKKELFFFSTKSIFFFRKKEKAFAGFRHLCTVVLVKFLDFKWQGYLTSTPFQKANLPLICFAAGVGWG